jgi:hypothetical protein
MAMMDKSHGIMDVNTPNNTKQPSSIEEGHTLADPTNEKNVTSGSLEKVSDSEAQEDEKPSEDAQNGVKKIEAVTLAWSKKSLAGVLILYVLVLPRLPFCIADIPPCQ